MAQFCVNTSCGCKVLDFYSHYLHLKSINYVDFYFFFNVNMCYIFVLYILQYPSGLNSFKKYQWKTWNFPEFIHIFQSKTFIMDLVSKWYLFCRFSSTWSNVKELISYFELNIHKPIADKIIDVEILGCFLIWQNPVDQKQMKKHFLLEYFIVWFFQNTVFHDKLECIRSILSLCYVYVDIHCKSII